MKLKNQLQTNPRLLAAFLSFAASIIVITSSQLTNTDGVLYLRVSEAFLNQGFGAAREMLDIPYYSLIIGIISKISGASPLLSAHLLNAATCAALAWLIVDLSILIGGSRLSGFCAGALFILHPQLNEYRGYIIRDFMFWTCLLGFLNFQLRFYLSLRSAHLLFSLLFLIFGSLFRIESLLLLIIPVITLIPLRKHISLVRQTLTTYKYLLIASIPLILILLEGSLLSTDTLLHPAKRFLHIGSQFHQNLMQLYLFFYLIE